MCVCVRVCVPPAYGALQPLKFWNRHANRNVSCSASLVTAPRQELALLNG